MMSFLCYPPFAWHLALSGPFGQRRTDGQTDGPGESRVSGQSDFSKKFRNWKIRVSGVRPRPARPLSAARGNRIVPSNYATAENVQRDALARLYAP